VATELAGDEAHGVAAGQRDDLVRLLRDAERQRHLLTLRIKQELDGGDPAAVNARARWSGEK
jgi:hypothetical protein